jgi:hypothetical protein
VIVEVPQVGFFLLPADFPNASFCHLADPRPVGLRVAQSPFAVHSIVLWYARLGIDSGRSAAPLKEIDLSQACDFLILRNVMGSV